MLVLVQVNLFGCVGEKFADYTFGTARKNLRTLEKTGHALISSSSLRIKKGLVFMTHITQTHENVNG